MNNIKTFTKLLAFSLVLIFTNCQKEEEVKIDEINDSLYTYELLSFNEFALATTNSERLLSESLDKLNNRARQNGRTYNNLVFSVDSTNIAAIIHDSGYKSFTLPIISNRDANIVQNIIINEYSKGDEKTYLAEYKTDISVDLISLDELKYHITRTKLTELINPKY